MPVVGLLKRAEALQSPVHAGGAHEAAHGGETSQMHCECAARAVGVGPGQGHWAGWGSGFPAGPCASAVGMDPAEGAWPGCGRSRGL